MKSSASVDEAVYEEQKPPEGGSARFVKVLVGSAPFAKLFFVLVKRLADALEHLVTG